MIFIPYTSFSIESKKKPDELIETLNRCVDPKMPTSPFFYEGGKHLAGLVNDNHFRGRRIPKSRNIFLPTIDLTIELCESGSRALVRMTDFNIVFGILLGGIYFFIKGTGLNTILILLACVYVFILAFPMPK